MWLKMLGSVMTIAATSWAGLEIAYKYKQRPLQLRALQSSLQMLETEINYGLTPLPRALEKIAASQQGSVGEFFGAVRNHLQPGVIVREAWEKGLEALCAKQTLTVADRHILINFGTTLGISDRQDQVKHLKLIMTQLANAETEAWEAKEKNERMFKSLGFLSGLAVVIILY